MDEEIYEEMIEESAKSGEKKVVRFITKAEYILAHDGDEMSSENKKKLKSMIEKARELYKKAKKSKSEEESKKIYKQICTELKPYLNNKGFLKFLKDYYLFNLTGELIGGLCAAAGITIGSIAGGAASMDDPDMVKLVSSSMGAALGITGGVIGGVKLTKQLNHEGRKQYLKSNNKYKPLEESYFNY